MTCKIIIEPFNYDVSQVVGHPFGLDPIKTNKQLVYGPHLYEPIFSKAKSLLMCHLKQQKFLGIHEIIIGEFGDLSMGKD